MTVAPLFFFLPFIMAALGWLVAKLAVFLFLSLALKKRAQVGAAIGRYAEDQIKLDALEEKLTSPQSIEKIIPFADEHVEQFLRVKLPAAMPMLAMFISDKLVADMKGIFLNELKELFPALIRQYTANLKKDLNISALVSARLNEVSDQTLYSLLKKQLLVVDMACMATGFLCGCLYILLTWIA